MVGLPLWGLMYSYHMAQLMGAPWGNQKVKNREFRYVLHIPINFTYDIITFCVLSIHDTQLKDRDLSEIAIWYLIWKSYIKMILISPRFIGETNTSIWTGTLHYEVCQPVDCRCPTRGYWFKPGAGYALARLHTIGVLIGNLSVQVISCL
jgi:hypothetical protein